MNIPVNENAPVKSHGVMEISAPVGVVWQVLTNIDDWPVWQKDVTRASLLGGLGEGSEFEWKAGGVPFRSRIHTVVTERMLGWTGTTIGASAIHNWSFEELHGVTTVRVEESLQGFLPHLFRKFFQKNLDAGIRKSLEELRSTSEGGLPGKGPGNGSAA